MLVIRLTRIGKKKQPEYRFIISEKTKDPWGKALEILGNYNPRSTPVTVTLKKDRIEYWISKGAQCSDTVWNILMDQGLVRARRGKSFPSPSAARKSWPRNKPKYSQNPTIRWDFCAVKALTFSHFCGINGCSLK